MKEKVLFSDGRYYGLKNLEAVITEIDGRLILVSRHKTLRRAKLIAYGHSKRAKKRIYATVSLIGNPQHDYRPGDILNKSDIWWPRVADSCSMCCHPYAGPGMPDSLDFRCSMFRDSPVCARVEAARFLPLTLIKEQHYENF